MGPFILQWNCNGLYNNIAELKKIINELEPTVICIQETHLKNFQTPSLRGYTIYNKNSTHQRARGGVLIAIKNNIFVTEINLATNLEAVAINIKYPTPITICNIYISPSEPIDRTELNVLTNNLPKPYVLLGDFNCHNTLWGSIRNDSRGLIMVDVMDDNNLICLNTGDDTHFSLAYNSFSSIDLSLVSSNVSINFQWRVIPDLHGSDHFPILIDFLQNKTTKTKRPKWILQKANWELYSDKVVPLFKLNDSTVDDDVKCFTELIIKAAKKSIPRTSDISRRAPVPWWSESIATAIRDRKKALRNFNRNPTTDNLILFQKSRAKAKYLIRTGRRKTWQEYVSTINKTTPISKVFNKVRKISGLPTGSGSIIIENGKSITKPKYVANVIARTFALYNSTENYSTDFKRIKTPRKK